MRREMAVASQREAIMGSPLRVGFLSPINSLDPDALSGMPCAMRRVLSSRGIEIVPLDRAAAAPLRRFVPGALKRRIPRAARRAWRSARARLAAGVQWTVSSQYERRALRAALARAGDLSRRIRHAAPDVLFGCCISSMLYGLETDVPIVYFSDATARLINETYPAYRSRCSGYKWLCDHFERQTMACVTFASFASRCARDSAVLDYGLDRRISRVISMGANITPSPGIHPRCDAPRRDNLRLCMIASDPRRKRVSLAVEVVERLNVLGWSATLTHIGEPCRVLRRSAFVRSLGPLRLSSRADRGLVARALASCHLLLLPSVGEAFGIAPCEAAHFGRPSVVSAAGGLPEVVLHGKSGVVLPLDASGGDFAEVIAALAEDRAKYHRLSQGALEQARTRLNWEAWADGVIPLIRSAAGRGELASEVLVQSEAQVCAAPGVGSGQWAAS